MINLAADDRTELLRILIPLPMLRNERGREAILESASLQQLLPQLDLSGEPAVAIPLMVKTFATYGRLTYEHEALGRFLSTMRDYVGLEERSILDRIISRYNLMTPLAKSPTSDDWTVPVTSKDFLEKIIGENTLRPIAFLQKGINASRSVAYLEISDGVKKWSGTGFLISPNLLMTNHHVLPDKSLLNGTICRFNYQLDVKGNAELYEDYSVSEEGTYYSNLNLDYSIVELKGSPGTKWNYLTLRPNVPTQDARINVIQHPNGLPKQISIHNNFVKFSNAFKIQYVTSTLPGSSGSPVLDDAWNVVGLHHAGGMLPEDSDTLLYFRNEAVTIRAIVDDLPAQLKSQLTIAKE